VDRPAWNEVAMPASAVSIRQVGWLVAILGVIATLLTLIVQFNLTGAPPAIDDAADFPTRVLAAQPFIVSRWPIELAGNLLFAALFAGLLVLAALLSNRTRRLEVLALLGGGGILGIASQLTYVGAHQVAVNVLYCDCGFKTEEIISQTWGLMLIDGVATWVLNGAAVLLAGGAVVLVGALAGQRLPSAFDPVSWLLAGLLLLSVVLSAIGLEGPVAPLLIAVVSGILLPFWAWMLATRLAEGDGPGVA
jgi:hypothetical protein